MKNFRWFRSAPFNNQLSINPDTASTGDSGTTKSDRVRGSISFNGAALGAAGLGLLALAAIACSKEDHKVPASTGMNVSQPVVVPPPAVQQVPQAVLQAENKKTAKKPVHRRSEKVAYKNNIYGVSFLYPRRYALKTGDEAIVDWFGSQPVGMNFVDGSGVSVAAVELPRGLYPGTDYRDAFFTVSVNRNLSEVQCAQFAAVDSSDTDEEPVAPAAVNFGGQVYSQTSVFDGKAFEQAYAHYYHVYNNGDCYEMALGLETAGYGAVEGVTPVDRDEVFHKLEGMLASVRLRPEERMPETSVAGSQPAAAQSAATGVTVEVPAADEGTH